MVAGVKVAVVFHGEPRPAGLGKYAERSRAAHPQADLILEELNEDATDILAVPAVEDVAEELAVGAR